MTTSTLPRSLGEPHYYVGDYRDTPESAYLDGTEPEASYAEFSPERSWRSGESADWYVPELLSGGDYAGDSVTVANHRAFLEQFGERPGVIRLYGGYGTYAVAIHKSAIDDDMREMFAELDDYPVIDDELMSEVEHEAENAAWESWVRDDFRRELESRFGEDSTESITDDALFTLFLDACEDSNTYWVNEVDNTAWIDLERVAAAVDALS